MTPIKEFSNILIEENVEAPYVPKLKTTRSILSNPSSISAGRVGMRGASSKSKETEYKGDILVSIRDESKKRV